MIVALARKVGLPLKDVLALVWGLFPELRISAPRLLAADEIDDGGSLDTVWAFLAITVRELIDSVVLRLIRLMSEEMEKDVTATR